MYLRCIYVVYKVYISENEVYLGVKKVYIGKYFYVNGFLSI